jgi:hypothetical protein
MPAVAISLHPLGVVAVARLVVFEPLCCRTRARCLGGAWFALPRGSDVALSLGCRCGAVARLVVASVLLTDGVTC